MGASSQILYCAHSTQYSHLVANLLALMSCPAMHGLSVSLSYCMVDTVTADH